MPLAANTSSALAKAGSAKAWVSMPTNNGPVMPIFCLWSHSAWLIARICASLKALLKAEPRCPEVPNATRCAATFGSGWPAKYAVTSRGMLASMLGSTILPARGSTLADTSFPQQFQSRQCRWVLRIRTRDRRRSLQSVPVIARSGARNDAWSVPRFLTMLTPADSARRWAFALFCRPDSSHIRPMAKNPDHPKKPAKAPKSKAHRPDVQPIGPALAELLNPAINRGDAGMGSGTGLQPPPDNSWDRRTGGEAAAHRARASTRGSSDDVAKRDAALAKRDASFSPPPAREA